MEGLKNIDPRPTDLGLEKFKILKKYLWLLNLTPYSRRFFLVGSMAYGKVNAQSDIDLVVVARQNRVWLNRILLNLVAMAVGKRRNKKVRASKFCFNASIAEGSSVNLQNLYPNKILIKNNSNSGIVTKIKTVLEYILEITLLAPILEYLSKNILTTYVKKQFSKFKTQKNKVLTLTNNHIIYHPPQVTVFDEVDLAVVEKL